MPPGLFVSRGDRGDQPPPEGFDDLPPDAPLAMPAQDFNTAPPLSVEPERGGHTLPRRIFLVVMTSLFGMAGAREMVAPLAQNGIDILDAGYFLLFFALFAWISFGFLNAAAGFLVLLRTGPGLPRPLAQARLPVSRTAVLVPIYNEEVEALFARLRAMTRSVEGVGGRGLFDFFILSDSHEANEAGERFAFRRLRDDSAVPVYYRRRALNEARKPGNIADWVTRFGGAYEYMIVLDADSLMSGAAMARLASLMDARPHFGLVQTVPAIVNGRTLFALWQQFAAAAYGPVASAGLRWWSGAEATFWGHNAIIRTRAFAESCGLPLLSGREPFGGHVMSHDMVEAALLRRRGWAVHMLPLPDGSYEEFPPTLIEHAIRDRRWCQGNLQHLRLLGTAGFHWVNRLQLFMGASAYVTSPLWMLLLFTSFLEPMRGGDNRLALLPSGWLLVATIVLLFGPRLIALVWTWIDHDLRAKLGGGKTLLASVCLEMPISVLVAPILMVTQTSGIVDILRGRPSGWSPQQRVASGLRWREVAPRYGGHMAMGLLFALIACSGVGGTLWAVPVAAGLLLAPLTAIVTSRTDIAERLSTRGLLVTEGRAPGPGEHIPPACWAGLMATPESIGLLNP